MIINYETLEKYLEHNKNSGLSFWNLINNYIKTNHTEKIISIYSNEFKNITNIATNLFPKLKSEINRNKLSRNYQYYHYINNCASNLDASKECCC